MGRQKPKFGGYIAIRLKGEPIQDLLDNGVYIDFHDDFATISNSEGRELANFTPKMLSIFLGQLSVLHTAGVSTDELGITD